jgi:hypothetical protein
MLYTSHIIATRVLVEDLHVTCSSDVGVLLWLSQCAGKCVE